MGRIYHDVKNLLDLGDSPVIFCGCPCQVDALKVFLGKDYDNLILIDLLCHGVPSPWAYNKYLNEIGWGKEVAEVDFRDKKKGWGTLLSVKFKDGSVYQEVHTGDYFRAFYSGLNLRKGCYHCKYAQPKRVGDITIGDFWGIYRYKKDLNDGKGTSVVLVNTHKGEEFIKKLEKYITVKEEIPIEKNLEIAKQHNGALIKPSWKPVMRKCFFNHLKKDSFYHALSYAEKRLMDVGILGWWNETISSNYGSTLTCYALHQFIESLGLSACFVSPPGFNRDHAGRFNKKHNYRMTKMYTKEEMHENNKYINAYVVGSDVLWYYDVFIENGYFFMLDFVSEEKKKISYATSFGRTNRFFPDSEIPKARLLLKRFDKVGVREHEGVEICRDKFGIEATQVLDPVFICDKSNWYNIAYEAQRKTQGKFLFAYMLDPTPEKAETLKYMANHMGLELVTITDKQFDKEAKEKILENYGILKDATIEELLYHISNAEFVVTDSYHGLCFSIIFKKSFVAIKNIKRGEMRFVTLADLFGLHERMTYNLEEVRENPQFMERIDYDAIKHKIDAEINRSANWLKDGLLSPKQISKEENNYLYEEILNLKRTIFDMQKALNLIQNQQK